jgi:co-chaperonin GroES (HSP10)
MPLTNGHIEVGGYTLTEVSAEVLLASDTLTVSAGGLVVVGAESGTADNLATINIGTGLIESGWQLTLYLTATIGDTITVKNGSGNIVTNTGADITLTENKMVILQRFIGATNAVVNNKWKCIG